MNANMMRLISYELVIRTNGGQMQNSETPINGNESKITSTVEYPSLLGIVGGFRLMPLIYSKPIANAPYTMLSTTPSCNAK